RPNSGELHNNLGIALQDLHRYEEARVHYLAALAIDPANIFARTNLGNVLLELHRLDGAERHFREALRIDPQNARAHQGLAVLLLTRGKAGEAASHGRAGFRSGVETRPYRGSGHPVNALVLYSALGGNLKTEDWLDSQTFASTTLVMEFVDPGEPLPDHDVLINGIGDVERGPAALAAAAALEARLSAAIVNRPAAVAATGRVENARRLAELPGVRPILTLAFPRAELAGEEGPARLQAAGFGWPLLVRSPGYHTGEHFHKVDHPAQLASAVASLPGDEVVSIEFVDVAAADGFARKYRVMTVDGRLYPLHLAVSPLWKVHYVTAGMAKRPEHRAEDEAFLADMPPALGDVAMRTLEQIGRMLELDYAGVDFSLDASGRLVVFEANATMVAPPPDADELWDYRRPAVAAVHAAVRAMLLQRAGSSAV
ncbi:MAG: tetratricopeptide repeat protein, partial [Chloroflexi bacterium]|nr:tetratricopeptide repeat protein [Chloroflexota bacterium]